MDWRLNLFFRGCGEQERGAPPPPQRMNKLIHKKTFPPLPADGEDYEQGFLNGIAGSGLIVLLISNASLKGIIENAAHRQDNVLIEMEVALQRLEERKASVLPLFVPERTAGGSFVPFKFPQARRPFAAALPLL